MHQGLPEPAEDVVPTLEALERRAVVQKEVDDRGVKRVAAAI